MASLSRPEFAKLESLLQIELDNTLAERNELGLSSPDNYQFMITYYNSQGAKAQASHTPSGALMGINLLPASYPHLESKDQDKVGAVIKYFDIVRDFLSNPHENIILGLIDNPADVITQYEESFPSGTFDEHKTFFESRGTNYDEFKSFAIDNAGFVKKYVGELLPKLATVFEQIDFSSLRHEMDHADFFSLDVYLQYMNSQVEAAQMKQEFHHGNSGLPAKTYAAANMRALESTSEAIPLLEIRALFFNYMDPDDKSFSNGSVIEKVYAHFDQNYIQGALPEEVLDKLVSNLWSEGDMDRETSNYLFWKINSDRDSPNALRYNYDEHKVNSGIAQDILSEVEVWQEKFRQNARTAVDAIGRAYELDPTKLASANKAKTFDEYITLCSF